MTNVHFACVIAVLGVLAAPPAWGQHHPPHVGPPPHELIRQNAETIGLDAETLDAILDLARDARAGRALVLAEVQRSRAELELLLREDIPDTEAVFLAIEVVGAAEVALRQYDVGVLIDMRSMLTAEQREALADLFDRRPPLTGRPPPPPGGVFPPPHQ